MVKKRKREHQEEVFLSESGREMTLSSFDLLPKRAHEVQVFVPRRSRALLFAPLEVDKQDERIRTRVDRQAGRSGGPWVLC